MIGCDHEILVKWFEYNFEQDIHMNMNWENYNIWAIDHVYPLSHAMKLPEEDRKKYFKWNNLRPVLTQYNAEKHDKIIQEDIDLIRTRAGEFIKNNSGINLQL